MRLELRLKDYDLEQIFDLIIIGGGINGAGVARDASARGLTVLLLEKNDFGSGCSAHSTRLIHGGLRYLEHLEFSLVKESLLERENLLKNYPHLVNPLGLFIPCYEGNRNDLFKLNVGMSLYDWLSGKKSLEKYQSITASQIDKLNIKINGEGFQGGVYYFDGQVPFAERLVLENILTAKENGAICINHCEVTEIFCSQIHGKYHIQGLRFKDLINGKRPYKVYGKNIINMSGPWVDKVNIRLRDAASEKITKVLDPRIGGTKGSHIVVKKFTGGPQEFGIYNEAKSDHRPFFILPFKVGMNDNLYLIGTTDLFLAKEDNLDELEASRQEIFYLLDECNALFPEANLKVSDVVKTFVGVRPLPFVSNKKTSGITRKHFIVNHSKEQLENYYSVVGGKLTTFRSLAEETVDLFSPRRCTTVIDKTINSRFPKDKNFYDYIQETVKAYTSKYEIDASTVLHLIMLYGSSANKVLDLCLQNPLLKQKIHVDYPDIEAQIVYAIRYEQAYTVDDILQRRISIGLCTNSFDRDIIKTIKYHIEEEFELENRHRDKVFTEVLIGDYSH